MHAFCTYHLVLPKTLKEYEKLLCMHHTSAGYPSIAVSMLSEGLNLQAWRCTSACAPLVVSIASVFFPMLLATKNLGTISFPHATTAGRNGQDLHVGWPWGFERPLFVHLFGLTMSQTRVLGVQAGFGPFSATNFVQHADLVLEESQSWKHTKPREVDHAPKELIPCGQLVP